MVDFLYPKDVALAVLLVLAAGALLGHMIGLRTDRLLGGVVPQVEAEVRACELAHASVCAVEAGRVVPVGR